MKKWFKACGIFVLIVSLILPASVGILTYASEESPLSGGEEGLLKFLDIVAEADTEYDRNITRGELAHIAARVSAASYSGSERIFYDVSSEHPYYEDICALAEAGVVNGTGGGYFSPEDAVSYEAACKVFSSLLGYGNVVPAYDWIRAARTAGVTDGVDSSVQITYGQAILMAYNTLHAEMLEGIVYGEGVTYQRQEGYLAIERYHNLVPQNGILDGYYGTTLTHPEAIDSETVLIGGKEFDYDGGEALFGQAVVFYTEPEGKNIEYIYADEDKNNIVTVQAEDVIGKQDNSFLYYLNDKEKKVNISRETDVVINGVAYPDYVSDDLVPAAGCVTLIDNNNDKNYDVIIVESYVYVVLKGIDTENKVLYGRYPEITVGDADRDDVLFEVRQNGKLIYPKNLKEGSVVAIKQSYNSTGMMKFMVEWLEGVCEGYVEKLSDDYITIGGNEYRMSLGAVEDINVGIGDYVTIYTHLDQCAVIVHPENDVFKVGYLVSIAKDGNAFDENLRLQLVDVNKDIHVFDVSENVNVDGTSEKDPDAVLTKLANSASQTYATNNWSRSQLVRYRLNNDGVVTHLDTLYYDAAKEAEDSLKLREGETTYERVEYNTSNRSFYDLDTGDFKYSVRNSASAIWGLPQQFRDEPEWYINWLANNGQYMIEVYNLDDDSMVAEYVVAYIGRTTTVSDASTPYVVTACETVINEDGDAVKKISVLGGGSEKTVEKVLATELSDTDIEIGDVVQFREDYRGKEIVSIKVVYDTENVPDAADRYRATGTAGTSSYSVQLRMAYGTVKAVNDRFVTHTTSVVEDIDGITTENLNNYLVTSSAKIYIYDKSDRNPSVKVGTIDDIISYSAVPGNPDKAIISEEYGVLKMIYLIKN